MKIPDVTSRHLRFLVALAALVVVLALLWFAGRTAQEGQNADNRADERDAAVGAAETVIDCVKSPEKTPAECEAAAEAAQQTLEAKVPPVGLTGRQRREVVLIAAELVEARPELSQDDAVDEVLDRLPEVVDGTRGPAGRRGAPGPAPSTAEVRALVEAVYAANPPPAGTDGQDGTDGSTGAPGRDGKDVTADMVDAGIDRYCSVRGDCAGPQGQQGDRGEPGPAGPAGDTGPPGPAGVGITSIACDSITPFTLTVTYSDGTTATYACGADSPLQ